MVAACAPAADAAKVNETVTAAATYASAATAAAAAAARTVSRNSVPHHSAMIPLHSHAIGCNANAAVC